MDLALNNLKWLICLKTKPNQTKYLSIYLSIYVCVCAVRIKFF